MNFVFSMIPLPPPANHDLTIHKSCFLTLQCSKNAGGLALPDFKLYYLLFQVKSLRTWCNMEAVTFWKHIEEETAKPHNIANVLILWDET